MLLEATSKMDLPDELKSSICARAFEDNQGAFYLATNQRITSRTKYFLLKWHWFHQFINPDGVYKASMNGEDPIGYDAMSVHEIDTSLQDADYMTKALTFELFEANRLRVQEW